MLRYFGIMLACCSLMASEQFVQSLFHSDHRDGLIKIDRVQSDLRFKDLSVDQAWEYLQRHYERYGLTEDLDGLSFERERKSLLGSHFHFSQSHQGTPVFGAEIIVSLRRDGSVYMVFNNTHPIESGAKRLDPAPLVQVDEAYDLAWSDLRVHGPLILEPSDELVFYPEEGSLRLVYLVQLAVEKPYGYWEHRIDAATGEILNVRQTVISRRPLEQSFSTYHGAVLNRQQAFRDFQNRSLSQAQKVESTKRASGKADVFDPDPVTTLQDSALRDNTQGTVFLPAYVNRDLQDITQSGSTFSLTGPWVRISDVEPPQTAPSTTNNGMWTAKRGDNAFNDAMTYFHIDQSQRYMQSLGFQGATGIQFNSIRADSDGAGGADNSFYSPSANFVSFGHGCVDDNEDAFVILHEYGHAIQHSINNNWQGGDTGGMGEGFGDYWAGSYKFSTPNGPSFHPEWAFPWDGHNNCWGGRLMDVNGQYNASLTYEAHDFVGGVLSDELWSTPLFQSLVSLTQMGVARSEVDQIVLQAHFGTGAGLEMHEMAQLIVNTASDLHPTGPHAQVFHDKFEIQNIITTVTTVPTTSKTLVLAWVSNNSQFESIVVVNNYGDTSANLTLTAQRETGSGSTVMRTVPAKGFLSEDASSLFPALGDGTGYTVKIESDSTSVTGAWVTNNLDAASGRSPSQGVAVVVPSSGTSEVGVGTKLMFSYLPITDGLTSAPVIVNLGTSSTNVTMKYYNQQGTLIATDTSTLANLTPFRPFAAVANTLVPPGSTDVYMIAESSGEPITGVGFVFNHVSEPAIGNATALP